MNALVISGAGAVTLTIAQDAITTRDEALAEAADIHSVNSALALQFAGNALRSLQAVRKGVEVSRKAVKEPVLKLGRDIDAKAAEFVAKVETEFIRIEGIVALYNREQLRIQREAEERERRENEAREREQQRLHDEAERARKAAENAVTEEQHAAATQKARQAEQEAAKVAAAPVVAQVAAPVKVAGVSAAPTWTFELTNVEELAKSRPELVQITPRRAEILTRIRAGERDIPGLRIFEDVRTTVRA